MPDSRGTLYLVPTPLGNTEDMSPRAMRILAEVQLIAAEDTRMTSALLAALNLPFKELISYHEHNEKSREAQLLYRLQRGESIALVTDAGMPAISDPGAILVEACIREGITVAALPGPNAALTALTASGLDTRHFFFEGFLPASGAERKTRLAYLTDFPYTFILYEAPHRLLKSLEDLVLCLGARRRICLARELSKTYESYLYLEISQAIEQLQQEPPRGEYVLVLEGQLAYRERLPELREEAKAAERSRLKEDIQLLKQAGLSDRSCLELLGKFYSFGKNEIYALLKESY